MEISINEVLKFNPCSSMLENLFKQVGEDFDKDQKIDVASLVGGENKLSDITWLLWEMDKKPILVEIAIYSAELVLHIYEEDNSSDAPRKVIQAAKENLKEQSKENDFKAKKAVVYAFSANANTVYAAAAKDAVIQAGVVSVAAFGDGDDVAIIAAAKSIYAAVAVAAATAAYAADADIAYVRNEIKDKILTKFIELINRG